MHIRSNPIYLSTEVYRWLKLLAQAESPGQECAVAMGSKIATADAIADQILRQAIREQHPQLAEHQKQIDALEKAVLDKLREARN